MKLFFDDAEMDGQLQRTLIAANSQSADLGETLAVAARIKVGDYASWFDEWSAAATRAQAAGESSFAAGHRVSARQAFLRATEYWRQAIFFIRHDLDDPRLQRGWLAHREAFARALTLFDHEVTTADIPFEGANMRAYYFRAPRNQGEGSATGGRATAILPCGYDSTAEAGYSATGYMAIKHGYDCLVFEGPGQGGTLYQQRIAMRADFEAAMAPVVTWLLTQPGVDPDRVVMIGRSFGGYLAPRAAAHDHRFAALVCDPGQFDFVSRIVGKMFDQDYWQRVLAADPATDAELDQVVAASPQSQEYFGARMATMGAKRLGDFLRMQPAYTLADCAGDISCPVLLTDGEGDFASQADVLMDHLTAPKSLVRFTDASGAGGHCEGMGATAFEEVVFDWLDVTLGLTGEVPAS